MQKIQEESVVYVYNWADYIPQPIIKEFEKETGIRVIYDSFDSLEVLEAKLFLQASYDLVFPSAWPQFARGVQADLFCPLNYEWIPAAKELDPLLLEKIDKADPGHRYGIPYLWGTTGIGYDEKAVLSKNPNAQTNSWALFFSRSEIELLGGMRIQMLDSPLDVLQSALIYLGYNPQKATEKQWKEAILLVESVRPLISNFENGRQIESLVNGQSFIIQGFSTYIHMAKDQGAKMLTPKKIRYVIPKEGAMVWFDMMAIPKTAPHPRNAHRLINFLLRPQIMARLSNTLKAANPIPSSHPYIDKDLLKDPMIFPDSETMKRIYPETLFSLDFQRWISRVWLKIKIGYREKY